MKHLFYLVFTLLIFFNANAQPPFYIQTCNNMTKVEDADPDGITPKKWVVRLYKKDFPTNGNLFWGTITGTSASEVMDKLQRDQDFELRFNAFIGKGYVKDNIYTHFNPLGPIALLDDCKDQKSITEESDENVSEVTEKAADYLDVYNEVKRKLDIILKGKPSTAFDNLGKVFKEYSDNLKSAVAQVLSLKKLLNSSSQQSMNEIKKSLTDIDSKLNTAANKAQIISNKINQIETAKNNNESLHSNYMYFLGEAIVPGDDFYPSGVRATKRLLFISDPIAYSGAFQGNDDIQERRAFEAAVQNISPEFRINGVNFSAYGFNALSSNLNACQNAIEEKKQSIRAGWGGDSKRFEIIDIKMKTANGQQYQDNPIPIRQVGEDEVDYKIKIYNLGVNYYNGTGVQKNDKKAFECFKKSASTASGWHPSMVNVGMCYLKGIGTTKNYWEALRWFTKSKGMDGSMYFLGTMYEQGLGVEKDAQKSHDWYLKAAMAGNKAASSMFNTFKLEAYYFHDENTSGYSYTLTLPDNAKRIVTSPWLEDIKETENQYFIDRTTYDIYVGSHIYGLRTDGTVKTFYVLKLKNGNGKKYIKFRFLNSKDEIKELCLGVDVFKFIDCSSVLAENLNIVDLTK